MLAVRPGYRRLGAGTALVEWGTKAADEQGLQVTMKSSFPDPLAYVFRICME